MTDAQPVAVAADDTPRNPLTAATHRDPYPYYARLVAETPFYRDPELGFWVASSAAAVRAVLTHPACRVRPASEPVPRALLGSAAGEIFARLVRMNDGAGHCPFKRAISDTLAALPESLVAHESRRWAQVLAEERPPAADAQHVTRFAFRLSAYVVASLLGLPTTALARVAAWVHDFVRCLAPSPNVAGAESEDGLRRGIAAAEALNTTLRGLLAAGGASTGGLLTMLSREAQRFGRFEPEIIVANGVGFLSQSYEATAGLIANTVLALARHDGLRERLAADPALLTGIVAEVARYDSPVQNTRRFLVIDAEVAGRALSAGDAVLVLLAAANRDPAAHVEPTRFDAARAPGGSFTFGLGAHACPGERLASTIAEAGVAQLLAGGLDLTACSRAVTYRRSANTRIPLWEGAIS